MEDNTKLGSSAAESTKTYSAKELADVYKISRPEFFGLDAITQASRRSPSPTA